MGPTQRIDSIAVKSLDGAKSGRWAGRRARNPDRLRGFSEPELPSAVMGRFRRRSGRGSKRPHRENERSQGNNRRRRPDQYLELRRYFVLSEFTILYYHFEQIRVLSDP